MQNDSPTIKRWLSQDIDELSGRLHGWQQEFRQLGCGNFLGEICMVRAPGLAIIAETTNQSLHQIIMPPPDSLVFGMALNPDHALHISGRPVGVSSLIILEGGREYDFRTNGTTELMGLCIDRSLFEKVIRNGNADLLRNSINQNVVPLDRDAATMLRQFWLMLLRILDAHDIWPASTPLHLLRDTAISNIMLALILGTASSLPQMIVPADREAHVVRTAIRFMTGHINCNISIDDVCATTHVSRRTLQYYFDHYLQVSPLQYLKVLRLNTARRLLRDGVGNHNIKEIAARCGYDHASRFAGDYKRQFGMLPSEALRAVLQLS